MIGPDSIVERRLEVLEADLHGDRIALSIDTGTCYGFNATASRIWELLETPRAVRAIVADLVRRFEVDAERCERETLALLRDLAADGLVAPRAAA
jgi:hypothetical protein